MILALDLGTTTGYAIAGADGGITSGTAEFRLEPLAERRDALPAIQALAHRDSRTRLAASTWACYEEVRNHAGIDAAHAFMADCSRSLTACCDHHDIAYQGVPVGTIKRFIAGKGNADKAAVIAAVRARGFNPADDNEADALAILLWAIETQGGVR